MAGWIARRLGNGYYAVVDYENPDLSPNVSVSGTISSNPELTSNFGRIMNDQVRDSEEIRKEFSCTNGTGCEYVAYGPIGASINDSVWLCVRRVWVNGVVTRTQYKENIVWANRAQGWI